MTEGGAPDQRRLLVARAMKLARKRYGTMRRFTNELREAIGWRSLSMAAVYAWEAGSTRIPAVALVAAAELAQVSVDDLLAAAASGEAEVAPATQSIESRLQRLEDRLQLIESRIS